MWELLVTVGVFYVLTGIWCVVGYALIKVPNIAKAIARWGHYLVPVMFIGVGVGILWSDDSLEVFYSLGKDIHFHTIE